MTDTEMSEYHSGYRDGWMALYPRKIGRNPDYDRGYVDGSRDDAEAKEGVHEQREAERATMAQS